MQSHSAAELGPAMIFSSTTTKYATKVVPPLAVSVGLGRTVSLGWLHAINANNVADRVEFAVVESVIGPKTISLLLQQPH
jgi:hypothetical protein